MLSFVVFVGLFSTEIQPQCFIWRFNYNHGHNIMRIFDVLPNFPFTTSETKPDY